MSYWYNSNEKILVKFENNNEEILFCKSEELKQNVKYKFFLLNKETGDFKTEITQSEYNDYTDKYICNKDPIKLEKYIKSQYQPKRTDVIIPYRLQSEKEKEERERIKKIYKEAKRQKEEQERQKQKEEQERQKQIKEDEEFARKLQQEEQEEEREKQRIQIELRRKKREQDRKRKEELERQKEAERLQREVEEYNFLNNNLKKIIPQHDGKIRLKIIGPRKSYMHKIRLSHNGETIERDILYFGDEHYDLQACITPTREDREPYKLIEHALANNDIEYAKVIFKTTLKKRAISNFKKYIERTQDYLFIFDYIMLLSIIDDNFTDSFLQNYKCIDYFLETNIGEQHQFFQDQDRSIFGWQDEWYRSSDYLGILWTMFTFCGKVTLSQASKGNIEKTYFDPSFCKVNLPSIRFHQSDNRIKYSEFQLQTVYNDRFNVQGSKHNIFIKTLEEYINYIIKTNIDEMYSGNFRQLKIFQRYGDILRQIEITKRIRKQFDKSIFYTEDTQSKDLLIKQLLDNTKKFDTRLGYRGRLTNLNMFNSTFSVLQMNLFSLFRLFPQIGISTSISNKISTTTSKNCSGKEVKLSILYFGYKHTEFIIKFMNEYYSDLVESSSIYTIKSRNRCVHIPI
jgi:hypothetical protein